MISLSVNYIYRQLGMNLAADDYLLHLILPVGISFTRFKPWLTPLISIVEILSQWIFEICFICRFFPTTRVGL